MQQQLISFPHGGLGPDGKPLKHQVRHSAGGILTTACGVDALDTVVKHHGDSDDLKGTEWYLCLNCERVIDSKEDA